MELTIALLMKLVGTLLFAIILAIGFRIGNALCNKFAGTMVVA